MEYLNGTSASRFEILEQTESFSIRMKNTEKK